MRKKPEKLDPSLRDWVNRNPHVEAIGGLWEDILAGVLLVACLAACWLLLALVAV